MLFESFSSPFMPLRFLWSERFMFKYSRVSHLVRGTVWPPPSSVSTCHREMLPRLVLRCTYARIRSRETKRSRYGGCPSMKPKGNQHLNPFFHRALSIVSKVLDMKAADFDCLTFLDGETIFVVFSPVKDRPRSISHGLRPSRIVINLSNH